MQPSSFFNNTPKQALSQSNLDTTDLNDTIRESINNTEVPTYYIPVILGVGALIIGIIIIVMFQSQIVLGMNLLWQQIKKLFGYNSADSDMETPSAVPVPTDPIDNSAINSILPGKKEVFNIAIDKYKYSDAEPLCKAFGAELATYDQVKDAWNKGADWCNYGWVKGQAAVYPTSQATYDKLQAGPEDERMSCGVPGVNGGYFDNPDLKFGVNCYGQKPTENATDDRHIMGEKNLTPGMLKYDKKVQDYKHHLNEIPVNPFKTGTWTS
jgi:hypothetical protein